MNNIEDDDSSQIDCNEEIAVTGKDNVGYQIVENVTTRRGWVRYEAENSPSPIFALKSESIPARTDAAHKSKCKNLKKNIVSYFSSPHSQCALFTLDFKRKLTAVIIALFIGFAQAFWPAQQFARPQSACIFEVAPDIANWRIIETIFHLECYFGLSQLEKRCYLAQGIPPRDTLKETTVPDSNSTICIQESFKPYVPNIFEDTLTSGHDPPVKLNDQNPLGGPTGFSFSSYDASIYDFLGEFKSSSCELSSSSELSSKDKSAEHDSHDLKMGSVDPIVGISLSNVDIKLTCDYVPYICHNQWIKADLFELSEAIPNFKINGSLDVALISSMNKNHFFMKQELADMLGKLHTHTGNLLKDVGTTVKGLDALDSEMNTLSIGKRYGVIVWLEKSVDCTFNVYIIEKRFIALIEFVQATLTTEFTILLNEMQNQDTPGIKIKGPKPFKDPDKSSFENENIGDIGFEKRESKFAIFWTNGYVYGKKYSVGSVDSGGGGSDGGGDDGGGGGDDGSDGDDGDGDENMNSSGKGGKGGNGKDGKNQNGFGKNRSGGGGGESRKHFKKN